MTSLKNRICILRIFMKTRAIIIRDSHDAHQELRRVIDFEVEEFWTLGLRANQNLIEIKCLFRGTVDHCMVHPRDIFRFACLTSASKLIIAHNHPSNERHPSCEDIRLTKQLVRASLMMEIPIVDHLILTHDGFYSMAEGGWL